MTHEPSLAPGIAPSMGLGTKFGPALSTQLAAFPSAVARDWMARAGREGPRPSLESGDSTPVPTRITALIHSAIRFRMGRKRAAHARHAADDGS